MKFLDILKEQSEKTFLREDEKRALRESLLVYIDKNPIQIKEQSVNVGYTAKKILSSKYFIVTCTVIIVCCLCTGGVVYASGASLPGDKLYPVKINFVEKIRGLFIFSEKGKARYELQLAAHRLEEAEKLNAEARLSSEARVALWNNFKHHITVFNGSVKKLADHQDVTDVATYNSELISTITNHFSILQTMTSHK